MGIDHIDDIAHAAKLVVTEVRCIAGRHVATLVHRLTGVDTLSAAMHRPRFRSPLRGPWLTSVFGLVLLVGLPFVILRGLLSFVAYGPQLGQARPGDVGWLHLPFFDWPTRPSWLYLVTQSIHVGLGLVLVPVVLAKLWSVTPRLFTWPPVRSPAQALERLSLLMLVGGVLFEIATGVLNIQYDYIFGFSFYTAHYFGAHMVLKVPRMARSVRSRSMRAELRTPLAATVPAPPDPDGLVAADPSPATISRRGALALVFGGSALVPGLTAGQTVVGVTRRFALLLPRGRATGPGGFQVNRTAAAARVTPADTTGGNWHVGERARCRWTGRLCWRCRSTPRRCRSPVSRDGRPRRPGAGSGSATSPPWPACATCRTRM